MPTIVVYRGNAPAVEGGGFLFEKDKPVKVPNEVAESLGSAFEIASKKGEGK